MNKLLMTLLVSSLAAWAPFAVAQEDADGWNQRRDKEGIQVFTKDVEGSRHNAVRSITVVKGIRLSAMVALIGDAPACADWADRCAESFVHERISDTELYVYTHNSMPFPVKDRDVLAHVKWSQDPDTLEVVMTSKAVVGKKDKVRKRMRLTEAEAHWRFKPLGNDEIEISSYAHINPGSNLPGWVTNMLLVDTPFETVKAFLAEVKKPKYRDAEVSFITEP